MSSDDRPRSDETALSASAPARRNPHDYLMPSTFEERGAAVPFTTPALAHARVRKDWRDRMELRLGNLAGTNGNYVVPWSSVRDLVPMTGHDQMLFDTVRERRAIDPHGVRLAACEVARTGLAGPDVAENAARALKADEQAEALHQVLLILQLVREAGDEGVGDLLQKVKTPEGQAKIRDLLGVTGSRCGLSEKALDARITELGHATYAVGVKWSPDNPRLRVIFDRLVELEATLREWAETRLGESAQQANFAADVAKHTIVIAADTLRRYDALMVRPAALLPLDSFEGKEAVRLASRMAWLVDGWEAIVEGWYLCRREGEQIDYLAQAMAILPWVPRDEIQSTEAHALSDEFIRSSRRWVRMNTDWRTGEVDIDLVQRIEASRALCR